MKWRLFFLAIVVLVPYWAPKGRPAIILTNAYQIVLHSLECGLSIKLSVMATLRSMLPFSFFDSLTYAVMFL